MLILILVLAVGGIYTCRLIILHLQHRDSPLGAKLCSTSGKFNCDKVLRSGLGKISKNIHLADIGLAYFISQSLFIILESINGRIASCTEIITIPCLLAFAISCFFLGYQAFLIRSWCKMCLIITGLVWLQQLVLIMGYVLRNNISKDYFSEGTFGQDHLPSLMMFAASLAMASTWFFIKKLMAAAGEVEVTKRKILLFKKNANIFRAALKTQRTIDTTLWEDDFLLGARNASTQLVVALNPYCPPCAREYREVLQLLQLFPDAIVVAIRFFAPPKVDKATNAARQLLQEYSSTPITKQPQILEKWFSSMSLDDRGRSSPGQDPALEHLLQKHQQWFEENKIVHTPTFFINGHEFPKLYELSDLRMLMAKLAKRPLKFAPVRESQ